MSPRKKTPVGPEIDLTPVVVQNDPSEPPFRLVKCSECNFLFEHVKMRPGTAVDECPICSWRKAEADAQHLREMMTGRDGRTVNVVAEGRRPGSLADMLVEARTRPIPTVEPIRPVVPPPPIAPERTDQVAALQRELARQAVIINTLRTQSADGAAIVELSDVALRACRMSRSEVREQDVEQRVMAVLRASDARHQTRERTRARPEMRLLDSLVDAGAEVTTFEVSERNVQWANREMFTFRVTLAIDAERMRNVPPGVLRDIPDPRVRNAVMSTRERVVQGVAERVRASNPNVPVNPVAETLTLPVVLQVPPTPTPPEAPATSVGGVNVPQLRQPTPGRPGAGVPDFVQDPHGRPVRVEPWGSVPPVGPGPGGEEASGIESRAYVQRYEEAQRQIRRWAADQLASDLDPRTAAEVQRLARSVLDRENPRT